MLKISANDAQLTVVACGPITSDRIDLPCEITLSSEFDGLAVTVVFKAGDVQRDVAMLGSPVHVPAECLEQAGEVLMVGIWAGDGSGRPTIPTVWASAGTIRTGVLPSGYDPDEPEPDWAAQVQQAAAQAVATANSVRADADAGAFDGADGYSPTATVEQLADGATITITDKDGTTTATVHDGADGRDGRDGTDGADGYSPTATVTQTAAGATISITDRSGTTTASVSNGADGTDGTDGFSPTVDVQAITGGHEVTITDADGAHSFEVLDGDPAEPGSITDAMLAPDGVKTQVAQLFGNQLTGTMSGTIDTVADAYAAPPMALTVDGASTQVTTTGKNLLPDVLPDNTINATMSSVISGATNARVFAIPCELNTDYIFSSNTNGTLSHIGFGDKLPATGDTVYEVAAMTNRRNWTANSGEHPYILVNVTSVASFKLIPSRQGQIEKGSTATTYEPYTGGKPSPSPDYPQPILSVDDLSLVTRGKNLFDKDTVTSGYTILTDGTLQATEGLNVSDFIPVSASQTLTYSIPAGTKQYNKRIVCFDSNKDYIGTIVETTGNPAGACSITGTTQTNAAYARVACETARLSEAQLELGSTATAYEPYQDTTVPDLLPEGTELRSLPDGTKDTLSLAYLRPSTRAGWAWYSRTLTAYTGEVDLGSLNWSSWVNSGGENQKFQASLSEIPANWTRQIAYCSCYTVVGATSISSVMQDDTIGNRANSRAVLVRDARFVESGDAASFKAAVSGQKITYRLETPVTTQLDPIELPELPAPTCTVWCDGGSAQPTFQMQYVQDTNIVIADLRAALADLATS